MKKFDPAMMKLVLDSGALSIWNHETGPIYWYAAGVPGPFYLNTEVMLGKTLADRLLEGITTIIADSRNPSERAKKLTALIMGAYESDATYQMIIAALVAKTKSDLAAFPCHVVSGGERRDWLFSIPLARAIGLKHFYLFKDQSVFLEPGAPTAGHALHVADLINNAASYFDNWLPILKKHYFDCPATLAVNTRGKKGVDRLRSNHIEVAALNNVDLDFFDACLEQKFISQTTRDELAVFFQSEQEWAEHYLMKKPELFTPKGLEAKSADRMRSFFDKDPWCLRPKFGAVFADHTTIKS